VLFYGYHSGYQRRGVFSREYVFNNLGRFGVNFNGDGINLVSKRYLVFQRSVFCVNCGIEGLYFAKERSAKRIAIQIKGTGKHRYEFRLMNGSHWHLNLYALRRRDNGTYKEVLMTKDHIIPKSKNGEDTLSNLQTMCSTCNENKGNKVAIDLRGIRTFGQSLDRPLVYEMLQGSLDLNEIRGTVLQSCVC